MSVRTTGTTLGWVHQDVVRSRGLRSAIGVAAFAAATAFGAKVVVPLPGTPVPFTLQVLFIVLAGALLGARLGAASQALYLAIGAAGAPVFAAGGGIAYLLGPTGGYLLAAPFAAFVVGTVAGRSNHAARLALALALGVATVHAGGVAWLTVLTRDPATAFATGVVPFLIGDVVKIAVGVLVCMRVRRRALELF